MIGKLLLSIALALPVASWSHDGHDHGDGAPVGNANGPSRQPDGSVFLPKPAQRQLSVRTVMTAERDLDRVIELAGKVVMDANAGGKVQSTTAGRLEAPSRGLPSVGQSVRKGEVLAYVVPAASAIERASQTAQLAEWRAARALAAKRLDRMRELSDTVPRKEIEALEGEVESLTARGDAIGGGLTTREALIAPVSGVIASAHAVSGQVVDARELVYEVIDPRRLSIEAMAFDVEMGLGVKAASAAVGNQRVPLQFVGAARALRNHSLPLLFRAQGALLQQLAIGQPVKVFVQRESKIRGVPVPAATLMKNSANQTIVWVKTAPERFEPRVVTTEPLDGVNVAVTAGLQAGDRVATQGASLINQIR